MNEKQAELPSGLAHGLIRDGAAVGLAAGTMATHFSLNDFIDHLPGAVWAKDANGRYLFANTAYYAFFERDASQPVLGLSDSELFNAHDAAAFQEKDREIISTRQSEQFYESVSLPSGIKHVLTLKFALCDAQGVSYAACGMCFDITALVHEREGLQLTNSDLVIRNQLLLALSHSAAIDAGDLKASLTLVAATAAKGLDVARVGVWLWDDTRESLLCAHAQVQHSEAGDAGDADSSRLSRSQYPLYFAALDQQRIIDAHDAQTDPRTSELSQAYLKREGISSMLDVPIRLAGKTAGVLCCEHVGPPRVWSGAEASFAAALADSIGRALVAQHRQQADAALREINQQLETRVAHETREAKRAETEARAARQQLQDITNHMPGVVFQMLWLEPGRFRFLYLSDGISRLTGLAAPVLMASPKAILDLMPPEDRVALLSATDAAALLPGQQFERTFRMRSALTGAVHWIRTQSHGRALAEGGVLFNGSFIDITSTKRLEDQVAESERLLKAAMTASRDGIWEWNLLTDDVFFSPSWFQQLGYTEPYLPQRLETFTQLVHEDDLAETFSRVARCVESVDSLAYQAEFRMRCADGSWRWMLGRGNVSQRDADGRALRLTGTNTDIDIHKRLEISLAEASQQAQIASKAKGEFVANMSHEIRTPMNAVIGLANLLNHTRLDEQQRGYLDKLQGASRTLMALINDVLDLSKIEAGKLELEQRPFALSGVLDNLLLLTQSQASNQGLTLQHEVPSGLPDLLIGDAMRLGQVLLNLVSNAIKFTEQGEVKLAIKSLPSAAGLLSLQFAVSDTGIGIAPDRVNDLFLPFEQADASTSRRYGGTGLGLTICHQLVKLMGGSMGVHSVLDQGSTFWFVVDFVLAAEATGASAVTTGAAALDTTPLQGLRVLVAEDNDINLEILTELLNRAGVEVRAARDGGEAVAVCAEGWAQLVLMDMQMPDIDGLTATLMLRKDPRFAALPIIALTANAMQEDRERCLAVGMNDHLPKPIDVEDLYAMIERWRPKK